MRAEQMDDVFLISGARSLISESTSVYLDDWAKSRILKIAIRQLRIVERRHDSEFRGIAVEMISKAKIKAQ